MESREKSYSITDHHSSFHDSAPLWLKLITIDFGIDANVLKEFIPTLNCRLLYKRLELLQANKDLSKKIRDFCRFLPNQKKLLVCLSDREDLLQFLPVEEDPIWFNVSLASDCPHVYKLIVNRHVEYDNIIPIVLESGNLAAVKWLERRHPAFNLEHMHLHGAKDYPALNLLTRAVSSDNLELLLYLKEKTERFDLAAAEVFLHAVKEGSIHCATWLKSWCEKSGIVLTIDDIAAALATRSAEMTELVFGQSGIYHRERPKLNEFIQVMFSTSKSKAWSNYYLGRLWEMEGGSDASMAFLKIMDGSVVNVELMAIAVKYGHLEMAQYLVTSQFPAYFTELTKDKAQWLLKDALTSGNGDLVQYLIENISKQVRDGEAVISEILLAEPRRIPIRWFDKEASVYESLRNSFMRSHYPEAAPPTLAH